jgi:hypothetical protein
VRFSARGAAFCAWLVASGCAPSIRTVEPEENRGGEVVEYAFGGIDGEVVSSMSTRGRVTILLFVTTFDVTSQAQARRLEDLFRTHVPRLNAVAVVLEAPRYVDLARTFRDVLGLHYPVAMVDQHAQGAHSILARVKAVPTWIVLDARGRLTFATEGALTPAELEKVVQRAE